MADPSHPMAGRKRRAESELSESSSGPLVAASSSVTLLDDPNSPSRTGATSTRAATHKKARLDGNESLIALSYDQYVKVEEEPVFLPDPEEEAALSVTASTRASTAEAPDQLEHSAQNAVVKVEDDATAPQASASSGGQVGTSSTQATQVASNSEAPTAPGQSAASRKRARLDQEGNNTSQVAIAPQRDPTVTPSRSLRDMPLELLSEILLYTNSIQAVLSVAMSCKYFCKTLLQPSSKYIWKYVRENNTPKPPPAFEGMMFGFDEVSYAAFLFAGGKCEGCGVYCDKPFVSFAIRLRLCGKQNCEDQVVKQNKLKIVEKVCRENNLRGQSGLFAYMEDKHLLKSYKTILADQPAQTYPYHDTPSSSITRSEVPDNLRSFLIEERDQPDFRERLDGLKKRQEKWMVFCKDVIRWRRTVKDLFYGKKKQNETVGRAIANEFGWKFEDMVNCTDFGPYIRNKSHTFQLIAKGDVAAMALKIEEQLTLLTEKRDRRTNEVLYQETRQQVLKHYKYLQTTKAFPVVPALSAFRQLPVILMLQSSSGEDKTEAKDVAHSLKTDKVLINLLKSHLNAWVIKAKQEFGEKMGVKRWKSISKVELHPAERMTARFKCKRCEVLEEGYVEDGCFDFVGACAHDCSKRGQKKNSGSWKWGSELFVKDEQASDAVKKYLELCKLPDKAVSTADSVAVLQAANYILCKSCDVPVVMKFNNLIGHSHRHEKMDFVLLKDPESVEAAIGKRYSFQGGLTKTLLGLGKKAQEARASKVYGCRHCYSKELADHRQTAAAKKAANPPAEGEVVEEEQEPDARLFIFDGLKSHLIEIHGIRSVRDEDYFCTKVPMCLANVKA